MESLREIIGNAEAKGIAIGHFNISDSATLKAIVEAARELHVPVLIGTSEGERDFIGVREAAAMVVELRGEFEYPIYLNADHTHSFEKVREAVEAGYDAVLFDGGTLSFEENIQETRAVVEYVKSVNPSIVVEGEIGYIGSSSEILTELPKGAAIKPEDLTTPEQAAEFVERTGVDLLAPAVGNIHGIVVQKGFKEKLDIARIAAIAGAVRTPLVLHGASGLTDQDLIAAIQAGVRIIHINTEIRRAWRQGIEKGLKSQPGEVAPYKLMPLAVSEIKRVVTERLKLFSNLS